MRPYGFSGIASAYRTEAAEFSTQLIQCTADHLKEIDDLIQACSEHWSLDRMSKVDRNILRAAVSEFLYF